MGVTLQTAPFSPGALLDAFIARTGEDTGAIVSFTGTVRSLPDAPVTAMTLEHYPELAHRQLERLRADAIARFDLRDADIIHRFGRLLAGEAIVMVITAAAHRGAAFDAGQFLMDRLKTDAPFWKREERPDGSANWVMPRAIDHDRSEGWDQ